MKTLSAEIKPPKPKAASVGLVFSKWGETVRNMPPAQRIEMIRDGVKVGLLVGAGQYYGLSQARLSKLLGISDATITRKIKSGGKLGPMESERLARIALIEAEADAVFGAPDLAKRWMLEPNLALGEAPLSLLDTDTGADEVRKVLAAIAYGGVV
ncbi:MAG: antitoxin Xre/MbcA/ParS toxin-binding domain-containing protein [Pseudomonadota bacterium]